MLVAVFLLSGLLSACQGSKPTAVEAVENVALIETTPAPTRALAVLPPTYTPTPRSLAADPTRTPSPIPSATHNLPQTMAAQATNAEAAECDKDPDSWEIKVKPYWQPGWCLVNTIGGYFYEYRLIYPQEWKVITFGEVFPNMAFSTGQPGIEVRLYQVYRYGARKYEGTLEDVPMKGSFCDTDDKCSLVVNPEEKITSTETRAVGGRDVFIVDSQDGKYNVRRYFFFVPFKYANPTSNRLFFFKLYTPEPFSSARYNSIEEKIERMIPSIRHDF